jgi:hypothetical protein
MVGADRLYVLLCPISTPSLTPSVIDQHPYLAFGEPNLATHAERATVACGWGGGTNDTSASYGVVIGGEWSNAVNNCGKWLNGVGSGNSYDTLPGGRTCAYWENWQAWSPAQRAEIRSYNMAQMDALQNFFFWTWRIGNSTEYGYATSPQWHYKLGVEQGWIPADPRAAAGYCRTLGVGGGQVSDESMSRLEGIQCDFRLCQCP